MSRGKLWILPAVCVISAAVLTGCGNPAATNSMGGTQKQDASIPVHPFDADDVTAYTYVYEDQLVMFSLDQNIWQDMTDPTVTLDTGKVQDFLEEMSGMTASEAVDSDDKAKYGLDSPVQMFAVVFSDNTSLTYCFGSEAGSDDSIYVQVTDDADDSGNHTVYTVPMSYITETLNRSMDSFR